MNVILICESAWVAGGAERVAVLEALELRRRGHRVGFIAAGDQIDPRLTEFGVEMLMLDAKSVFEQTSNTKRVQSLISNPFVREPVSQFLRTFDPADTIVHIHSFRLRLSGAVVDEAQKHGFKTVFHCHEYGTICPTALYFNHRTNQNCNLKPLSMKCITCNCQVEEWKYKLPKLTTAIGNKYILKIYERANLFIGVSNMSLEVLRPHLPKATKKVVIKAPQEIPETTNNGTGSAFAYIGRLVPEKGPALFLEAARIAKVESIVIGSGPLEAKLKRDYPEAKFLGWLNDTQLEAAFQEIRCLVVPSLWRETYGLSILDALGRGIPCIATSNVGAAEEIIQSNGGIVVKNADPNKLASAMSAINIDKQAEQLGENARQWNQLNRIDPTKFVDQLVEEFECLK